MRWGITVSLLLLAACGQYPRDIDGTFDRVRESGVLRVGYAPLDPRDRGSTEAFVDRLARAAGARPRASAAPAEHLLARLEQGEVDLVIGEFAQDSPWFDEVALLEPLSERRVGERKLGLAPVARNGENAWIGMIERTVRDARAGR